MFAKFDFSGQTENPTPTKTQSFPDFENKLQGVCIN